MLMTETNTETVRRKVIAAALTRLGRGRYEAHFEHDQWWVTRIKNGAQWSVVDCRGPAPGRGFSGQTKMVDYLDFEQVTQGDDEL